jgi:hypothetical protein
MVVLAAFAMMYGVYWHNIWYLIYILLLVHNKKAGKEEQVNWLVLKLPCGRELPSFSCHKIIVTKTKFNLLSSWELSNVRLY